MKRLLVFFLIGWLTLGAAASVSLSDPGGLGWAIGLPVVSFTVAFPSAAIDYARKDRRWQLVSAGACGCLVPILISPSMLAGVPGELSSAFCFWLTNQSWQPGHLGRV